MKEERNRRESFLPARHCCDCKFLFRGKREQRNGNPICESIAMMEQSFCETQRFINIADYKSYASSEILGLILDLF